MGKSASRAIQQHEAITSEHVAKVAARPAGQKLVRQNDLVDAVLVEGPVTIRLKSAKALSSGNVGESILALFENLQCHESIQTNTRAGVINC